MELFGTGARGFGTTWGEWRRPRRDYSDAYAEREREERRERNYVGLGPRGYQRTDERILEDVCVRLTDHPYIDASDMEVHVENGEVTLSGTVDSRGSKRLAEEVAESASGVKDVHNRLRVAAREAERV